MHYFENKANASKAGKKSRRGVSKNTDDLRNYISKITFDNEKKVNGWLHKVGEENPEKALKLYIQLLEFVLPKVDKIAFESRIDDEKEMKELMNFYEQND